MAFPTKLHRNTTLLQRLMPVCRGEFTAGLKPGPPKRIGSDPLIVSRNLFLRTSLLALLLVALAASASARTLNIERFSAEIIVEPDS
jgi:hypothetical protein